MKPISTGPLSAFMKKSGVAAVMVTVCTVLNATLPAPAAGQAVRLVKDITPGTTLTTESSFPTEFVEMGGHVYFAAEDPHHGRELWKTDGTAAGTAMVKDITGAPGKLKTSYWHGTAPYSSNPSNLTVVGSTLYFLTTDSFSQSLFSSFSPDLALWKSDGSSEGTVRVKHFPVDQPFGGGIPNGDVTVAGMKVYFRAATAPATIGMWVSDGTEEGTILLKDNVGYHNPIPSWYELPARNSLEKMSAVIGETVFFTVRGEGLWKTDGTVEGTVPVRLASPSYMTGPSWFTVVGDVLYFVWNGTGPLSLWKSDGTEAGTVPVANTPWITSLVKYGSTLYFANSGLWKTDGTSAGTVRVGYPTSSDGALQNASHLTPVGDTLFFRGYSYPAPGTLWKTDGTDAGTMVVRPAGLATPLSVLGYEALMVAGDETIYFEADDGSGLRLWKSDGTPAGTVPLPGPVIGRLASTSPYVGPVMSVVGEELYFAGTSTPAALHDIRNIEPCRTGGAPAEASVIRDLTRRANDTTINATIALGHDLIFFRQVDSSTNREIWRSDGTDGGTFMVTNVPSTTAPFFVGSGGGNVYFSASPPGGLPGLWRTNGTAAGTAQIKEVTVKSGFGHSQHPVYFVGETAGAGVELWTTDGTAGGTLIVRDISPGPNSSSPSSLVTLGDRFLFSATTSDVGRELWITDGTLGGTNLLKDIHPGAASSTPDRLMASGAYVYFGADDGVNGRSLWRTDGTAEGTLRVHAAAPASVAGMPGTALPIDNKLCYIGQLPGGQTGLWVSDGTGAGTSLLKERPSFSFKSPVVLGASGELVYFAYDNADYGEELWRTDGTPAGTYMIEDLVPGVGSAHPFGPIVPISPAGSALIAAGSPEHGFELRLSDGNNITLVRDIAPGSVSSIPMQMVRAGSRVFFTASDDTGSESSTGRELWVLNLSQTSATTDWTLY